MCVCEANASTTIQRHPERRKKFVVFPIFWLKLRKQSVESKVFRHNRENEWQVIFDKCIADAWEYL